MYLLNNVNYSKIYQIHEKINKKVYFKWNWVYLSRRPYKILSEDVYKKWNDMKFENTSIIVPNWYDAYLKTYYGDYMEPVVREWWHNCRYSVDVPYNDIIKWFDKNKSNYDNYNNCSNLFLL